MAQQANTFDDSTIGFFNSALDIEFISFTAETQVSNMKNVGRQAIEEWTRMSERMGAAIEPVFGSMLCLSIPDLRTEKFRWFPFGLHSVHDDRMLQLIEELGARTQAQCVCMVYECLEVFLKSFAVPLMFHRRNAPWELLDKEKFQSCKPLAKLAAKNTPQYFAEYVKYLTRSNCGDLLRELWRNLPGCRGQCEKNWFSDVLAMYRAISCIRHSAVHNGSELTEKARDKLQGWERGFIQQRQRKSVLSGKQIVFLAMIDARRLIEGMNGLVYCLYRAASEACDMKTIDLKELSDAQLK